MRKTLVIVAVVGILAGAILFTYVKSHSGMAQAPLTIMTATGPAHFVVEVARTKLEWEQGLMFRKSLAPDAGMLFDLHRERPVWFWMKNTLIPLDLLFITGNGNIVRIVSRAKPLSLRAIDSGQPVRAVLEIAGGRAKELGVNAGDRVENTIFNQQEH
jgi:uncharacterized membrane protein (UPF0127 family)